MSAFLGALLACVLSFVLGLLMRPARRASAPLPVRPVVSVAPSYPVVL